MPKIVLLSGSLRRESANSAVVATVRRILEAGDGRHDVRVLDPNDFPFFDEDVERTGGPARLQAARRLVADADALIVSTPAYNGYPSGVLKNALDWLSRPGGDSPLTGRRAAVVSASPGQGGGANSQEHLRQILGNCGAVVVEHDEVAVGNAIALRTDDGHIEDPVVVKELTGLVQAVLADIEAAADATLPAPA